MSAEAKRLVEKDPNYIHMRRFDYSLERLLKRYPEGAPTRVIAQALMMSEDAVDAMYQDIVLKIRSSLDIDVD